MLALLLSFLLSAGPRVTVVRELHKEAVCGPGLSVKVLHRYGDLVIVGSALDRVVVDAIVRVTARDEQSATELADKVDVGVMVLGETLVVATVFPQGPVSRFEPSFEVDVKLIVPKTAGLVARNSFGDLVVTGIEGGCRLFNRFGDVELEQCRDCEVLSRYGDVQVSGSSGMLVVDNRFGDVFLDQVTDRVRVENRYGDVHGAELDGVIHLGNRLGKVSARRSTGSLTVVNLYGDISAWVDDSGLTDLNVVSELGQVELNFGPMIPFKLDGRTVQGFIRSSPPLQTDEQGCRVFGVSGQGGPRVQLIGAWADFFIQAEPSDSNDAEGR